MLSIRSWLRKLWFLALVILLMRMRRLRKVIIFALRFLLVRRLSARVSVRARFLRLVRLVLVSARSAVLWRIFCLLILLSLRARVARVVLSRIIRVSRVARLSAPLSVVIILSSELTCGRNCEFDDVGM